MEGGPVPGDAITQIVTYLLSFGLPGVVIIGLSFAYYRKDQRCDELTDALGEVSKEYAMRATEHTAAINGLRELFLAGNSRSRRGQSGE